MHVGKEKVKEGGLSFSSFPFPFPFPSPSPSFFPNPLERALVYGWEIL